MFNFHGADPGHVDPKTYTTIGALPGHIDPNQPPNKKPWRTINDNTFVRSLELVMPQELRAIILDQIDQQFKVLTYEKLIMKLEEVLEESFFNDFVKKGMEAWNESNPRIQLLAPDLSSSSLNSCYHKSSASLCSRHLSTARLSGLAMSF